MNKISTLFKYCSHVEMWERPHCENLIDVAAELKTGGKILFKINKIGMENPDMDVIFEEQLKRYIKGANLKPLKQREEEFLKKNDPRAYR